jgi:hypothetical protein
VRRINDFLTIERLIAHRGPQHRRAAVEPSRKRVVAMTSSVRLLADRYLQGLRSPRDRCPGKGCDRKT